jgi:hypothetical protein
MATGATKIGVDRKSRIEEKLPTQTNQLRRVQGWGGRRERLKQLLGLPKPLSIGLRPGCQRNCDENRNTCDVEAELRQPSPTCGHEFTTAYQLRIESASFSEADRAFLTQF